MLGVHNDKAGKEFYRATPAMTRDFRLRTRSYPKDRPISRLLRQVGGTGTEDLF